MFLIQNERLYTTKTLILESWKMPFFPKGIVNNFGQTLEVSSNCFFLGQIDQKECLATFVILKNLFFPTNKLTVGS